MDLDSDPFEIENWEEFSKLCTSHGKLDHFKKVFSEYIYMTNLPLQREIQEYCNRRIGEWMEEEILDQIRRKRYAEEARRLSNLEAQKCDQML